MSNTIVIVAVVGAGAVLALLVALLLMRGRRRTNVIEAPARQPVPVGIVPVHTPTDTPPASMTMAAADSVLRAMVARGETINAIKMVREMTGLGLKEAKDYVDAMPNVPPIMQVARQRALAASGAAGAGAGAAAGGTAPPSASLRSEAAALLTAGQPIEAMKLIRERTGMGLREAQEYVDNLSRSLRAQSTDPRRQLEDPRLRNAVAQLLAAGQGIEAIQLIQRVSGVSIEAARHYIDQVRQG